MKRVRGHHLFCMALFAGHGYDEAFAENMAAVIRALKAGEPMALVAGRDAVCAACPNLLPGGGCALGTEDVRRRDAEALRVLGLAEGDGLTWQEARQRLQKTDGQGFAAVCGGCRWAEEGLCSWAVLQGRLA